MMTRISSASMSNTTPRIKCLVASIRRLHAETGALREAHRHVTGIALQDARRAGGVDRRTLPGRPAAVQPGTTHAGRAGRRERACGAEPGRRQGVSLTTLLRVAKALKRLDWIETIAPQVLTNPLTLPKHSLKRQRASQDKIERFKTAKIRRSLADMIAQCDLGSSQKTENKAR